MARKPPDHWDAKPLKPISYGPFARFHDYWAGVFDGRAGIPQVPVPMPDPLDPSLGATPFIDIRTHHYHDRSERERRRMLATTSDLRKQRTSLDHKIAAGEEALAMAQKKLEELPEQAPPDRLATRNAVEQNAPESLIRSRRQREHAAERRPLVDAERQAADQLRADRIRRGEIDGEIRVRHLIAASRVRQLRSHMLRRIGTYKRRLQRSHPAGPAVLPLLDLVMPGLPDWVEQPDPVLGAAGDGTGG